MLLATEEEVCILWNMFCEIKSIVFKIKIILRLIKLCSTCAKQNTSVNASDICSLLAK